VKLTSETDTELIVQLLGQELRDGKDLLNALYAVLPQLRGTWGLVLVDREQPDRLLATASGSPLLVGIGRGEMFLASEASAFVGRTKDYIELRDGEIVVLTAEGHSLDDSRVETAEVEVVQLSPAPWPHWTLKEIFEQPEAVSRSLNHGGRLLSRDTVMLGGMEQHRETLVGVRHLVVCACGTSYYAGLFGARLMRALRAFHTVQVFDAAEFTAEDLPWEHGGMLVISQSGETKDVHRALLVAQEHGVPTFSVVNVVRSMIARFTGCGVYLNAGREHAVASTKAFACQVSVLAQLAVWFAQVHQVEQQRRELLVNALHRLSTSLGMVLRRLRPACQELAARLLDARHLFVLGKGLAEPVAREGALKIKEITYMHAEGYPGGSLKHGPFALLEPGLPIFLIILRDRHEYFMWTTLEEVRARGAFTIVITDCAVKSHEQHIDCLLRIPNNGSLTSLLAVLPMQLFAYELSVLRGNNPDFPRNLAKTVTT
jgi:glutamine---fructose-6-phosphate transaminase (isomerizing)